MATQQTVANGAQPKYFNRFSIAQRVEHFVLILSFSILVLTGLPQKFAGNAISDWMISAMGGIETVRIIHRIAAVAIVLMSVYHVIVLGYKVWVRRVEMSMLPGLKDLTDALDLVRFNLGLAKEHPRMPRYNFGEKVEYWAMVWGTVIMAITGFMLWNPIATTRHLPGQIIPAAKAAHGGEAVLAALAILIWHFYNVHVKSLNKSMFNGKMSRHQMEEEHGAGTRTPDCRSDPARARSRRRPAPRAYLPARRDRAGAHRHCRCVPVRHLRADCYCDAALSCGSGARLHAAHADTGPQRDAGCGSADPACGRGTGAVRHVPRRERAEAVPV